MKAVGAAVMVLALGFGAYFYLMQAETSDVEAFCAALPAGSPAENIFETADRYSGKLMGGTKLIGGDKPQKFVYCSPMTMCDVSCSLEVQDGVITKSEFVSL